MDATPGHRENGNRNGNDDKNVHTIARITRGMTNKTAYKAIEALLIKAGYKRQYLTAMREAVWRARSAK
jgi:hypothetical protein